MKECSSQNTANPCSTKRTGWASLQIEQSDSVTGQILARAVDQRQEFGDDLKWTRPTHVANVNDARQAPGNWAQTLLEGLERARGKSQ
jgi:hypothetical protein